MGGFNTEGVMPVMPYGGGMDGFGSGGGGWITFLIIAMLFGWGRNGLGAGAGGFTGGEVFADQFALQDLKNGQRQIDSGIRGLESGLCQLGYATAQQGSQTRELVGLGFANLGSKIDNCCCETNRNIDALRYEGAKNTCDIITNANMNTRDLIEAGNANTQRIVDIMTNNTIQNLRDQNQALTLSAALQQQTANITAITNPRPIPAYPVCSPYEVFTGFGGCNGFNTCGN